MAVLSQMKTLYNATTFLGINPQLLYNFILPFKSPINDLIGFLKPTAVQDPSKWPSFIFRKVTETIFSLFLVPYQ